MTRSVSTKGCFKCLQADAEGTPGAVEGRIFGTWDFKWPHDHEIRVAFQRLPDDPGNRRLLQYLDRFRSAADRWLDGGAAIGLRYLDTCFLPPPGREDAKSVLAIPHMPLEYDVLVSFAALPQTLPLSERRAEPERLETQSCELGAYAMRVDYGVPTAFLGPADGVDVDVHLEHPWFEAMVVHEVGHLLGLAHEHQNPLYRRALSSEPQFQADRLAELAKWLPAGRFPESEIKEELTSTWSHAPIEGSEVPYSDWCEPPTDTSTPLEQLSVMAHFGWSYLIGETDSKHPLLTKPTEWDKSQLRTLYPGS